MDQYTELRCMDSFIQINDMTFLIIYSVYFLLSFSLLSNRTRMCNKTIPHLNFKKNHFKIFRVNVAVFKSRILHHSNNLQAVSSCTTLPSGNYCSFPWYITLYLYSYHNPNSFFVPLKLHLSLVSF